eukprot:56391_1
MGNTHKKPSVQRRATVGDTQNINNNINMNIDTTPKKRFSWNGNDINLLSPNPPKIDEEKNHNYNNEKITISTMHSANNILSPKKTVYNQHISKQKQLFLSPTKQTNGNNRISITSSLNAKLFSPSQHKSRKSVSTASPARYNHKPQQGFNYNNTNTNTNQTPNRRRSLDINEIVIASRFRLVKKLGKGSFGVAYKAFDSLTNEGVAIKLERKREGRRNTNKSTTMNEREISILERVSKCSRVPKLIWHGQYKQYNGIALQLQGQ